MAEHRKLFRRIQGRLKALLGPVIGGTIGAIGGIPGFLIGVLLGYLLGELFIQSRRDRKILEYLENPGARRFLEAEPGMAAFCALGVLVASKSSAGFTDKKSGRNPEAIPAKLNPGASGFSSEKIIKQVMLEAFYVFTSPKADPSLMEHFSRLAWSRKDSLNPDLLSESLASRRLSYGDAGKLGRHLFNLAEGEAAKNLADEIRVILDPGSRHESPVQEKDPWKILGLSPGTPHRELKAHYRRLAKQFHPDRLEALDEKHRETAARAFLAISEAYKQLSEGS